MALRPSDFSHPHPARSPSRIVMGVRSCFVNVACLLSILATLLTLLLYIPSLVPNALGMRIGFINPFRLSVAHVRHSQLGLHMSDLRLFFHRPSQPVLASVALHTAQLDHEQITASIANVTVAVHRPSTSLSKLATIRVENINIVLHDVHLLALATVSGVAVSTLSNALILSALETTSRLIASQTGLPLPVRVPTLENFRWDKDGGKCCTLHLEGLSWSLERKNQVQDSNWDVVLDVLSLPLSLWQLPDTIQEFKTSILAATAPGKLLDTIEIIVDHVSFSQDSF